MKESITQRQAISMVTLFIIGSSIVLGISRNSMQDAWIAFLLAVAVCIPLFLMYSRILKLYPGQDFYDIAITSLGRVGGTFLNLLFSLYALHLGALVMRNFSEFMVINALTQTPQLPVLISMLLLVIWVSKNGVEALGRWSSVSMPLLVILVFMILLISLKSMHPSNLLPVLSHPLKDIAMDASGIATFPFAETVLFMGIFGALRKDASPYKVYKWGVLIGGATLLIGVYFRNATVLGFPMLNTYIYPSYSAVSVVSLGNFLTRIEGFVGANLLIGGFVKTSVCLLAASRGIAKVLRIQDYRLLVIPLALLMLADASTVYQNTTEMLDWIGVYKYYALPFQLFIPLTVFIAAELRHRKKKPPSSVKVQPPPEPEGATE